MRSRMDIVTVPWLKGLSTHQPGPCVSIFMPTHRAGGREQDPLRLKNLLGDAASELDALGLRAPDAQRILRPAADLLSDAGAWAAPEDGLALFLAPDRFEMLRLPAEFEDLVVVSDRFHVRPLLPTLAVGHTWYLLAISKGHTQLYRGTRYRLSPTTVPGMPAGIDEALWYMDRERQVQHRAGQGRATALFHGHGGVKDTAGDELVQYLRKIDKAVASILAGQRVPLVAAGLERVASHYRAISRHPFVLDEAVTTNPDDLSLDELHARSWKIVEPRFAQLRTRQQAAMEAGFGGPSTSNKLHDIARASFEGRIDALWIAKGERRWGRWNPIEDSLEVHEDRHVGDYDVVDRIALTAWERGAALYVDEAWRTPGSGPLTALYRY